MTDLSAVGDGDLVSLVLHVDDSEIGEISLERVATGRAGVTAAMASIAAQYNESAWGEENLLIQRRTAGVERLAEKTARYGTTPEDERQAHILARFQSQIDTTDRLLDTRRFIEEVLEDNPYPNLDPVKIVDDSRAKLLLDEVQEPTLENILLGYLNSRKGAAFYLRIIK